jgi:hypothetical protein
LFLSRFRPAAWGRIFNRIAFCCLLLPAMPSKNHPTGGFWRLKYESIKNSPKGAFPFGLF